MTSLLFRNSVYFGGHIVRKRLTPTIVCSAQHVHRIGESRCWSSSSNVEVGNPAENRAVSSHVAKELPLVKRIARARVASNREAKELVEKGKVTVNRTKVKDPLLRVSMKDKVHIDGVGLLSTRSPRTKLLVAYKPRGELLARKDDVKHRKLFFERIESVKSVPRGLIAVGHLDFNSEGLVVLTNNGLLSDYLQSPVTALPRVYEVLVWSRFPVDAGLLAWFGAEFGVQVGCKNYQPLGVEVSPVATKRDKRMHKGIQKGSGNGHHTVLNVTLHEGQRHQIREILSSAGMVIKRLVRTQFGPFELKDMPPGGLQEFRNLRVLDKAIPNWRVEMQQYRDSKR